MDDIEETGYENAVGPEHIELTVQISARYVGNRLRGSFLVSDEITITLPQMDAKYVVFPKVMEGAVTNIIDAHRQKVMAARRKDEDEKRKEKEREKARANGFKFPDDTEITQA